MYDAVCNILTYCSLENIAIEYIEEFIFEGIFSVWVKVFLAFLTKVLYTTTQLLYFFSNYKMNHFGDGNLYIFWNVMKCFSTVALVFAYNIPNLKTF